MTATATPAAAGADATGPAASGGRSARRGSCSTSFLTVMALGWLAPLLLAVLRVAAPVPGDRRVRLLLLAAQAVPSTTTSRRGAARKCRSYFRNTLIIAVPAVLLVLFFASFVAFALSRFKIPGRKTLLIMFTAGNLLPPQVMVTPLYTAYTKIPLPEWMSVR